MVIHGSLCVATFAPAIGSCTCFFFYINTESYSVKDFFIFCAHFCVAIKSQSRIFVRFKGTLVLIS